MKCLLITIFQVILILESFGDEAMGVVSNDYMPGPAYSNLCSQVASQISSPFLVPANTNRTEVLEKQLKKYIVTSKEDCFVAGASIILGDLYHFRGKDREAIEIYTSIGQSGVQPYPKFDIKERVVYLANKSPELLGYKGRIEGNLYLPSGMNSHVLISATCLNYLEYTNMLVAVHRGKFLVSRIPEGRCEIHLQMDTSLGVVDRIESFIVSNDQEIDNVRIAIGNVVLSRPSVKKDHIVFEWSGFIPKRYSFRVIVRDTSDPINYYTVARDVDSITNHYSVNVNRDRFIGKDYVWFVIGYPSGSGFDLSDDSRRVQIRSTEGSFRIDKE